MNLKSTLFGLLPPRLQSESGQCAAAEETVARSERGRATVRERPTSVRMHSNSTQIAAATVS